MTSHNGLRIIPDFSFQSADREFDIVIVPGGPLKAILPNLRNTDLLKWISCQHEKGVMEASVCTGALLLAQANLLAGKKATTNGVALDYLRRKYSDVLKRSSIRTGKTICKANNDLYKFSVYN